MKRKTVSGIMLVLLATIAIITNVKPAGALLMTTLAVQPNYIKDPTLILGSCFRVNITVNKVENLSGFQFDLMYNEDILTATDGGSYPPFTRDVMFDVVESVVEGYDCAFLLATVEDYGLSLSTMTSVPIAWIEFSVDHRGHSPLYIINAKLGNPLGERIWVYVYGHGYFDNRLPSIPSVVELNPDTLNLRSKGQWIDSYIQLLEGYFAADVNAYTILLNGTITPILDPQYGFVTNSSGYLIDHNNDGILERMVRFDRAAVQSFIISHGISYGNVTLTITGKSRDGTPFEGTDIIFVNQGV